MLILQPTSGEKTIKIIPRTSDISGIIDMRIRRDGDGLTESIYDTVIKSDSTLYLSDSTSVTTDGSSDSDLLKATIDGNFVKITFTPTILEEDSTYYLEITNNNELWYRDKIYVTSQTEVEREDNKHEIGNGELYKPYSPVDDNTYII